MGKQHQTSATPSTATEKAPTAQGDSASNSTSNSDVAASIAQVSTDLSGCTGFLATLMSNASTAGTAIHTPDASSFATSGAAATSAAKSAETTIDAASSALDTAKTKEGATALPEWATAATDLESAGTELSTAVAGALGQLALPGGEGGGEGAGSGTAPAGSSAIAGAVSRVSPYVAHATALKGACTATAALTGKEAEGAAASLQALLDTHPGDLGYATGVVAAYAGLDVLAYLNGSGAAKDSEGLEAAASEAGSDTSGVKGAAPGPARVKPVTHADASGKVQRDGIGVKLSNTEVEDGKGDAQGTRSSASTQMGGKLGKDGLTVQGGAGEAHTDAHGNTARSSKSASATVGKDKLSLSGTSSAEKSIDGEQTSSSTTGKVDTDGNVEVSRKTAHDNGVGTSVGGGADFKMKKNGGLGLEGASVKASVKVGPLTVAGEFSFKDTFSGPVIAGDKYQVTTSRTFSIGAGGELTGSKGGAGMSGKQTETTTVTKLYATADEATAAVQGLVIPAAMPERPSIVAPDLDKLSEGESITMSSGIDMGASGSAGASVKVEAGAHAGGGDQVKLTKGPGDKVEITTMKLTREGLKAGVSSGVGVKGNLGRGKAQHTSVSLDLSTEAGKEAFERWSKRPESAPSGTGVKPVSTGSGSSSTTGYGVDATVAEASATGETGTYEENLANGDKQRTWYGKQESKSSVVMGIAKDRRAYGLTVRATESKGSTNTSYHLSTTVDASTALGGQKGLAAGHDRHYADAGATGKTNGAYTVEEEVSKKDMDTFVDAVQTGKHPADEDLKVALAEAGNDPDKRNEALTDYFARNGQKAMHTLKSCPGVDGGKRDYSLAGDAHITGKAGRARLTAKIKSIRERMMGPATLDSLQAEARALLGACEGSLAHVSNPANYADLPDGARREVLDGIRVDKAQISRLILDIETQRCDENGQLPSQTARTAVQEHETKLRTVRTHCEKEMGMAEVRRRLLRGVGSGSVRDKHAHNGTFTQADAAWAKAQRLYPKATAALAVFRGIDPFGAQGEGAAIAAAKVAQSAYADAGIAFGEATRKYQAITADAEQKGLVDTDNARPLWLPTTAKW